MVLEFGSTLAGAADPKSPRKSKATIYLAVLREGGVKDGSLVHRGEQSAAPAGLGESMSGLISEIVFDYSPESGEDVDSKISVREPNVLSGPVQVFNKLAATDRVGYAMSRSMNRQALCHITVHWSSAIGVAPLEIRHKVRAPLPPTPRLPQPYSTVRRTAPPLLSADWPRQHRPLRAARRRASPR